MSTWIFPSNPRTFDAVGALQELGEVSWSQVNAHDVGDIVYLYAAAPTQAIVAKCAVTAVDLPYQEAPEERPFWRDQAELDERADRRDWMRLSPLAFYDDGAAAGPHGLQALREHGFAKLVGRSVARGPLRRYLASIDTETTPEPVSYWWASQSTNWKSVIDEGTLWAGIHPDGSAPNHWKVLEDLRVGDVVFHYADQAIRAVSRVTEPPVRAPRPEIGYPKTKPDQPDNGWLVRVQPTHRGLNLASARATALVRHGPLGPIDRTGRPGYRYVSPVRRRDGQALLAELGITVPAESFYGRPAPEPETAGATDVETLTRARTEQRELRRYLLGGATHARCALCGRELPEQLLIAAHIAPRRDLTDQQRRQYGEIAMLACALGCDALFEWGHVVVDATGTIVRGTTTGTGDLEEVIAPLLGRRCTAHSVSTEPWFARRRTDR